MGEGTRPARPHARFTEDGRRVREVLSYSRRGSRFSEREQAAWDRREYDSTSRTRRPSSVNRACGLAGRIPSPIMVRCASGSVETCLRLR